MIRPIILSLCGLAVAGGAVLWAVFLRDEPTDRPVQEEIGGIVWERQLGRAVKKARDASKPMLVVFRCPP